MGRRRVVRTIKVLVSVALLTWLLHAIATRDGMSVLFARLSSLSPSWFTVAVALQAAAVALSIHRWKRLSRHDGLNASTGRFTAIFLKGRFFGAFTPGTMGLDVYRAVSLGRATGDMHRSSAIIVREKAYGLLGLLALLAVALFLGGRQLFGGTGTNTAATNTAALAGLSLLIFGTCICALVALSRIEDLCRALADETKGWHGLFQRIVTSAPRRHRLLKALRSLQTQRLPKRLATEQIVVAMAAHTMTAFVFYAGAQSIGLSLTLQTGFFVGVSIVLATILPISLGGIGVREGVAVALLSEVGVPVTDAVLMATIGYLATQPPALLGGFLVAREGTPAPVAAIQPSREHLL